ncbi:hypothetical protein Tco_0988411 [Tanacetum coccineum]|uniref:Uncharacterized protein n=1 Tax=Tanacetum coccineum TaxID=301880 RepID=A0ABQ5ER28_9ASTR
MAMENVMGVSFVTDFLGGDGVFDSNLHSYQVVLHPYALWQLISCLDYLATTDPRPEWHAAVPSMYFFSISPAPERLRRMSHLVNNVTAPTALIASFAAEVYDNSSCFLDALVQ